MCVAACYIEKVREVQRESTKVEGSSCRWITIFLQGQKQFDRFDRRLMYWGFDCMMPIGIFGSSWMEIFGTTKV